MPGACLSRQGKLDDAMSFLIQLPDAGELSPGQLLVDDDFAPLRQREDFKALIQRMSSRTFDIQPTHGFRGVYGWAPEGEPGAPNAGPHYLLSTMLACTSGRGNSVAEALDCLRRAAGADGTSPRGTIYYPINGDIRVRTRQWGFEAAAAKLRDLGVGAQVLPGDLVDRRPTSSASW